MVFKSQCQILQTFCISFSFQSILIPRAGIWHKAIIAGWQKYCCCYGNGTFSSSPSWQFIPTLSFTSPFSSVPSLVCLSYLLFFVCSLWGHYMSPPHTCTLRHVHKQIQRNCYLTIINRKIQQITPHKMTTHTHFLSLPCCMSVRLYPLLGVLQLFYCFTTMLLPNCHHPHCINYSQRPGTFCHSCSLCTL